MRKKRKKVEMEVEMEVENGKPLQSVPLTTTQQMLASGSGALMVSIFTTPFDVVKVRLQAQLKNQSTARAKPTSKLVEQCTCPPKKSAFAGPVFYGRNLHGTSFNMGCSVTRALYYTDVPCTIHSRRAAMCPNYFSSSLDALRKIAHYEGLSRLWRGFTPTLVMMVPQAMIYFTAYDQLKTLLGYHEGESSLAVPLGCGVTARVFAVCAISPIEMVRTKLQSRKQFKYSEVFSVVRNSVRQDGFLSMWRGVGPTLFRDVPFSAFYWVTYEYVKSYNSNPTFMMTFAAGAGSGMIAALCTTPFDVIKTHRQMEIGEGGVAAVRGSSTFQLIFSLYQKEGFASLFTGIGARLSKVAPACAIMISTYELGKKHFQRKNAQLA